MVTKGQFFAIGGRKVDPIERHAFDSENPFTELVQMEAKPFTELVESESRPVSIKELLGLMKEHKHDHHNPWAIEHWESVSSIEGDEIHMVYGDDGKGCPLKIRETNNAIHVICPICHEKYCIYSFTIHKR